MPVDLLHAPSLTLHALLSPALAWPALLTLLPVLYVACATPFLVVIDVRHRRLPNVIVLPGLAVAAATAAAAALWAGLDPGGTALVACVTLTVFVVFRAAGAIASGDVKLAVLLAAALAPAAGASFALYALAGSTTALTAGLASLLLLARTRRRARASASSRPCGLPSRDVVAASPTAEGRAHDIPLGPFLLLGFWVAVTAALVLPLS
ncbi:hypothetical protein B7R22_10745 [Subtercola boreus]|uniref:Prepilin type IV endopeptidase peptidase domain-containing protein n=1 Tax=Subtercola boreus TaxID=120213 RepID=A0A3E0VW42_9MICO|nr:prepilin peptidase [Subtercola boreus]RFA14086.1 hypothetical protein B7R22_10745 [Subtercola boreus]